MEAPHIFHARKYLKDGAEQKPRFLLCELKKPGMDFFNILLVPGIFPIPL
jgi:hypothetical protein